MCIFSFFLLFWAPAESPKLEPQHDFRRRKRYFLAFGCDFDGKKCFEHCKTRGFEISGTAETLYFASENTVFKTPSCPIYQNTTAAAVTETATIKTNLIAQLTAPVRWSQTIEQMINEGAKSFTEVGPGNVLQGLVRKINRDANTAAAIFEN